MRWRGWLLTVLIYLAAGGQVACGPGRPAVLLPTLAAGATVPPVTGQALPLPLLPPTFTPAVQPTWDTTATPARSATEPVPTATPFLPTATPTTPAPLPISDVPYEVRPPAQTACDGSGELFASGYSTHLGWRTFRAYIPPCYGHDGHVYPVIYLFHGSVQSASHWTDLGLARLADAGIAAGYYPPFIAIMPYNDQLGNMTSGGPNSVEGLTVSYLIPHVDAQFCSWAAAAGRSIGGISRGGYWALMIAFRRPDLFRGVAGHSSHLRFETDAPRYNPLATYADANLNGLRIWLDWGERDFLREGQAQLVANLQAAGISHTARINSGGHNDGYWATHLGTYLDWHLAGWPLAREALPLCAA